MIRSQGRPQMPENRNGDLEVEAKLKTLVNPQDIEETKSKLNMVMEFLNKLAKCCKSYETSHIENPLVRLTRADLTNEKEDAVIIIKGDFEIISESEDVIILARKKK